jgi:hypothetical protein
MKQINTFEDAKQAVAEKHKYTSWGSALRNLVYYGYLNTESEQGEALTKRDQDKFLEMEAEAAELYANIKVSASDSANKELMKSITDLHNRDIPQ